MERLASRQASKRASERASKTECWLLAPAHSGRPSARPAISLAGRPAATPFGRRGAQLGLEQSRARVINCKLRRRLGQLISAAPAGPLTGGGGLALWNWQNKSTRLQTGRIVRLAARAAKLEGRTL